MDAALKLFQELWEQSTFRMQVIGGLILMAILGPLAMWSTDRTKPLEFDKEGSFIIPNVATGGDQMLVMWRLVRPARSGCKGEVRRLLLDPDTKVILAEYAVEPSTATNLGSSLLLNKTFVLPKAMPKGWAAYRSDLCYSCNPLQSFITAARICYSTPELLFRVQ